MTDEKHRLLELTESVSGVGHWRIDIATDQVRWSDMVYAIHGVQRGDFAPTLQNSLALYHPDDQAKVGDSVRRAVATKEPFSFQVRINRPDGEIREVMSKGLCELDEHGEATAVFGVFQDVTEQTRALNAAKRSERRYRLLADNMGDVVTRIRLDGGSSYISPTIERVLGYRPEDMARRPAHAFVHEADQALVLSTFGRMAQGLEQQTLQHRAVHKDGRTVWVETSFRLVRDDQGRPKEIVAVIRDATERKGLEDATIAARDQARDQAQRAMMAERMAGVGHWRVEAATRAVSLSEQMYRIYGLSPALPLELDALMAMSHPDDQATAHQRLRVALATGEPMEEAVFRIVRSDGQVRSITSASVVEKDSDGQVVAVIGMMRDITEQRRSALALAQSEARYRLLAENASDVILHCDAAGRITYISPAVLAVIGRHPEDLIGSSVFEWIEPEDAFGVRAAVATQLRSRGTAPATAVEFRVRDKQGRELWFEARPTLAFDPVSGEVTGITDVLRDITARRALEAELRTARAQAEAAAAVKSEFLANMSHELRTPLTAVLGFSRLAEEQPELSDTTRGYLRRASNAGQALLLTVNDILDFSKLEAGQVEISPRPMSPAQVASETLELFTNQAASKGVALSLGDLEALPRAVRADPDRVRQILLNLIGNAVKFTATGGVRVDIAFESRDQRLTFKVTDTGPGIAEDRVDRLFQRFSQVDASSTRKHGGTGLGLAICKGLAEAMDGEIGVRSRAGEGSCFWFAIPAPAMEALAEVMIPAQDAVDLPTGLRVLVADDNRANRDLVRAMLTPLAAEITEASDGHGAVAAAANASFDIILMDLRMPGLDGAGATQRIRGENGPNAAVPILAFSADLEHAQGSGLFDGVVGKPLAGANLLTAISRAMAWPEDPSDNPA
ncbi:MAG TPA: PAS domain S-box protein [Caulobacter sp.]|nr:PAS domain S-box protein [Caulobacter sp.]